MPILVRLPNGQIARFPDGMAPEEIQRHLQALDPRDIAPDDSNLLQGAQAVGRVGSGLISNVVGATLGAASPDRAAPTVFGMSDADYDAVGTVTGFAANAKNFVNRGVELGQQAVAGAGELLAYSGAALDTAGLPGGGAHRMVGTLMQAPAQQTERERRALEEDRAARGLPSLHAQDRSVGLSSGLNRAGDAVVDYGQDLMQANTGAESRANQQALARAFDAEQGGGVLRGMGFVANPGNWATVADAAGPSLAEFGLSGGIIGRGVGAARASRALQRADEAAAAATAAGGDALAVARARTQALAAAAKEGGEAAGMASASTTAMHSAAAQAEQVRAEVEAMTPEQLAQLPGWAETVAALGFEPARQLAARMAADATLANSSLINLVTYAGAQRVGLNPFESAIAGGPSVAGRAGALTGASGRLARGGVHGLQEAGGEFVQGAGEQLGQNLGMAAIDARQDLTKDVITSGALEASIGMGMGVGTGLMSSPTPARKPIITPGTPAERAAPAPDASTPEGRGAAAADAILAEAGLDRPLVPPTQPALPGDAGDTTLDTLLAGYAPTVEDPDGVLAGQQAAAAAAAATHPEASPGVAAAPAPAAPVAPAVAAAVAAEGEGAAPTAADADPDNFGQAAWPITVPDTDPLWRAIPGGETINLDSPERDALRARIVREQFRGATPAQGRKPVAYLLGGGGASGKGTIKANLKDLGEVPATGAVDLDPDAIKAQLPEYAALVARGDSRAAAVVHEESSRLTNAARDVALRGGYDVILDRTLSDPAKARAELQQLKDAGYEIRLYGATLDPAQAVDRAYARAQKRGRYVPNSVLLKAHKGFAEGFEALVPYTDAVRLYDNSGRAPVVIGEGVGGRFDVTDQHAYTAFAQRRAINENATRHTELLPDPGPQPALAGGDGRARRAGEPDLREDPRAGQPGRDRRGADPAGPSQAAAGADPEAVAPASAGPVAAAAAQAATHPDSPHPAPTEAQKRAGNYAKGALTLDGLAISIENPAGSRRRPEWPPLAHAYGYVRGSEGADGDHVDVFLSEAATDTAKPVFVIDQTNGRGRFDEHKVMLGFDSAADARAAYLSNYTPGWRGLGGVTEMTWAQFKDWVRDPARTTERADAVDPIARAVESALERAGARGQRPAVKVVASVKALPATVRSQLDGATDGLYDPASGTIYLIREALPTDPQAAADRALWVLWHELAGHKGLRAAFPGPALAQVLDEAGRNPTVKALAAAIRADRAQTPGQAISAAEAVEEALAELAAALRTGDMAALEAAWGVPGLGAAEGVVSRVVRAIKAAIVKALGGRMPYSDAQVRELLGDAWSAVRDPRAPGPARQSRANDVTRTPAFRRWFGDSKVVDTNGEPLVVYHGTEAEFDVFRPSRSGTFGRGMYFADGASEAAEAYGERVVPAYLKMESPWEINVDVESQASYDEDHDHPGIEAILTLPSGRRMLDRAKRLGSPHFDSDLTDELVALGYDGVIATYPDGSREYVVFEPTQIKSATGNRGAFDPANPSIRQSRVSAADTAAPSRYTGTNAVEDNRNEQARPDRRGDRGRGPDARRAPAGAVAAPERAAPAALEGAPRVRGATGPDPRLTEVAEAYARAHGIAFTRQPEYVEVDPERAARIADAYADMAHAPDDPRVAAAYADLIAQTRAQYDALTEAGYRFWFIDIASEAGQAYAATPWNAMRDLRATQSMGVFPTAEGFGSDAAFDPAANPLLADTGLRWPVGGPDGALAPVYANDLFRAVHDAFGHGLEGAGFRARGEENAWQAHVRLFTGDAVGALTSETRGQNSWLNYGPHGATNRSASAEDTVFADQKTGLMPEWTWTEGRADATGPAEGLTLDEVMELLPEYGETVATTLDAERRLMNGDRVFAFHEQDEEGLPLEITVAADFVAHAPDQLLILPRAVEAAMLEPVRQSRRKTPAAGVIARTKKLSWLRRRGYPVTSFKQSGSTWNKSLKDAKGEALTTIRRLLQDRMIDVRDAQEDIEAALGQPLDDLANVYQAENLMHGRAADGVRRVRERLVEPLKQAVAASGLTVKEIERWLWAQHALERNARIAKINPGLPDGGSGLTNTEAQAILDAAGPNPALTRIDALVQALRLDTLNTLRNSGQITPEQFRALRGMYAHYVPLRGHAGDVGEARVGAGRGIDMRGKPVQRALGRTTAPANILGELVGDAERAQVQAAKAEVGRTLLRAALQHPNPDFWVVEPVTVTPRFSEATGEVYMAVTTDVNDEEVVIVKHKGQPYTVRLVDPQLRAAMKNLGVEGFEGVSRYLGWVNRWLSAVFTRYNPAFVPVNMLRDMIQGAIGVASEHGAKALAEVARIYPAAAAGLYAESRGAGDASVPDALKTMADWAREFLEAGGATGYQVFSDPDRLQQQIEVEMASLADLARRGRPVAAVAEAMRRSQLFQTIEAGNEIIENTMRLSVYVQRRRAGATRDRAATYAKNITVNFNRKGSATAIGNALFVFFNASMQGAHRVGVLLKDPKVLAGMGALAGLQFALAMTLGAARYEDEDETLWEKIPDHVKQRALVIPLGYSDIGGVRYLAIPMPYGFNLFPYVGGYPAQLASKTWRSRHDPVRQTMGDVARAGIDAFSVVPVGETGWYFPTVMRIFANLNANTDDLGRRIRDDGGFDKFEGPRASKGRADTPAAYKDLAKLLNRLGGGDDYTAPVVPMLDLAPEDIEYLLATFGGGPATALQQTWRGGERAGAGLALDFDDLPVARRVLGSQRKPQVDSTAYYDTREVYERGMARLRDTYAKDGEAAFYRQRAELGPMFEGIELDRYKTTAKDGRYRAGDVRTGSSGAPTLTPAEDSVFAVYREASKAVTGYNSAIRRVYSDASLDRMGRRREIERLQRERAAAMRRFVDDWNARL